MILAEITNFMCAQLLALRLSLNKWSDVIKYFVAWFKLICIVYFLISFLTHIILYSLCFWVYLLSARRSILITQDAGIDN